MAIRRHIVRQERARLAHGAGRLAHSIRRRRQVRKRLLFNRLQLPFDEELALIPKDRPVLVKGHPSRHQDDERRDKEHLAPSHARGRRALAERHQPSDQPLHQLECERPIRRERGLLLHVALEVRVGDGCAHLEQRDDDLWQDG